MNRLQTYLKETETDEAEAMNALQEHGIISDCAVLACDVPDCDSEKAIAFLAEHLPPY